MLISEARSRAAEAQDGELQALLNEFEAVKGVSLDLLEAEDRTKTIAILVSATSALLRNLQAGEGEMDATPELTRSFQKLRNLLHAETTSGTMIREDGG